MGFSLFVVDSRVADTDQLMKGLGPSAQVLAVSPEENAVARIAQVLDAHPAGIGRGIDRLEIVSHGQPGALLLGRDRLDAAQLTQYRDALKTWGRSLGQAGEIILHGCQVGAGAIGQAFVEQLHRLTGAGVAANQDITGGDRTEGNWVFDVLVGGAIGRSGLSRSARKSYAYTLAVFTVSNAADDGTGFSTGTLSEAI
ncbi:MAG: DUF4347 domain-containing protein, partial [Cyanobacteria bacterium P01_H01_bin.130]